MESAVLLVEPSESQAAARLKSLLAVFGVTGQSMSVAEFLTAAQVAADQSEFRLLATAASFLKLVETPADGVGANWQRHVHSAFVFTPGQPPVMEALARKITGDSQATFVPVQPGDDWVVSDQLPDFCQSMSGVRVAGKATGAESVLRWSPARQTAADIISAQNGPTFTRLDWGTTRCFYQWQTSLRLMPR